MVLKYCSSSVVSLMSEGLLIKVVEIIIFEYMMYTGELCPLRDQGVFELVNFREIDQFQAQD